MIAMALQSSLIQLRKMLILLIFEQASYQLMFPWQMKKFHEMEMA
jgi:hypothetical protein